MSLMAKFWNKEFKNIGVNTLWPRTTINTAPVRNILGGEEMINISRKTDIMGDAAYYILRSDPTICNGKNFIDDEVLVSLDIDIENYRVDPYAKEKDLMPDFFC
jgi:citronellol/citronellal dehydrogenase